MGIIRSQTHKTGGHGGAIKSYQNTCHLNPKFLCQNNLVIKWVRSMQSELLPPRKFLCDKVHRKIKNVKMYKPLPLIWLQQTQGLDKEMGHSSFKELIHHLPAQLLILCVRTVVLEQQISATMAKCYSHSREL